MGALLFESSILVRRNPAANVPNATRCNSENNSDKRHSGQEPRSLAILAGCNRFRGGTALLCNSRNGSIADLMRIVRVMETFQSSGTDKMLPGSASEADLIAESAAVDLRFELRKALTGFDHRCGAASGKGERASDHF